MTTAAGQLAVAMENARLFAEEQRRARYLGFLNNVSKTAISSQNADEMLAEIVAEIQKNFRFDHIGLKFLSNQPAPGSFPLVWYNFELQIWQA